MSFVWFQNKLGKPVSVGFELGDFRPWLVDVLLDFTIDVNSLISMAHEQQFWQPNLQNQLALVVALQNSLALQNVNQLLREILGFQNARPVRADMPDPES